MMDMVRWNPAKEMLGLRSQMDRMLSDFFGPSRRGDNGTSLWDWSPTVDVYDQDDRIVIKAELPGMEKKDISVDLNDRVLTLKGERSADNEVKEDKFYRRERFYGKFERSFTLPAAVEADKINADYKDGILKIEVPKPESQKPKQISVN